MPVNLPQDERRFILRELNTKIIPQDNRINIQILGELLLDKDNLLIIGREKPELLGRINLAINHVIENLIKEQQWAS